MCSKHGHEGSVKISLYTTFETPKLYTILHIFQSCPLGSTGVFTGLIVAPGPYVWHPLSGAWKRKGEAKVPEVQCEVSVVCDDDGADGGILTGL